MLQKEDINIMFRTKGAFTIARAVFNYPHKSFHIRELAKEGKCSTTAVTQGMELLKKYGIITVEEGKITTDIKADIDSEDYRKYKLIFNLYRLTRHKIVASLNKYFNNPECITLFGSFAKGEDIENSDIDILIITSLEKPRTKEFENFINMIEDEFNREISIHLLKSFKETADSFKNSAANGIVLHGYMKVI